MLKNMELSDLRVNFDKCGVYGVNVGDERLNEMAIIMECKVGKFSILYF